jgi:hypothetical protein
MKFKGGPGRPPKVGRPARAVSLTLPEDVLDRLAAEHADLGQAIVNLVEKGPRRRSRAAEAAELSNYGRHAVILVTPVPALKRLRGVELVPLGNGRALISLEATHSIPQLELELRDALDRASPAERRTLENLAAILRSARRSAVVHLEQRTIIVIESKRKRAKIATR